LDIIKSAKAVEKSASDWVCMALRFLLEAMEDRLGLDEDDEAHEDETDDIEPENINK